MGELLMSVLGSLYTVLAIHALLLPSSLADPAKEDAAYWERVGLADLQSSLGKLRVEGPAKNIIIIVGDGMGIVTQTMARIYKGQKNGGTGEEDFLSWETFPYSGLVKTYNTDYQVPDSAGTATAIMSGVKTRFGVLGVDMNVKYNVCETESLKKGKIESILDWGRASNKLVGVVTTARLTHATPGALYAHTPNRDWECDTSVPADKKECEDIASQLVRELEEGNIAVAMGGGIAKFRSKQNGGAREDKDLVDYMITKGIKVIRNSGELQAWDHSQPMIGLFGDSHMNYEVDRVQTNAGEPSLAEMTRQAINRLSKNPGGYVLLVEAGRIDHGHHDNQAKMALEETLQLDKTVKVVTDMVDIRDTLVMVTADHSHAVTMSGYPRRGNPMLGTVFHPEEEDWSWDFMLNNDNITQPYQVISYANGPGYRVHFDNVTNFWKNISLMDVNANDYKQPATFYLPYETHGGEDVSVYARGPQAHLVTGLHDQSFLGILMGYAGCMNKDKFGCPAANQASRRAVSPLVFITLCLPLLWN